MEKSNIIVSMVNFRKLILLFVAIFALSATAQTITGKYEVPKVPEWAKNAVFYQIYPQTFCDSDGDGIGDIQGIISKLDYVKSLGVDAIWFNPFFDSPFNDAGYDIRDYYKIAPRYGTNEDARQLFEEVHKRGMHVIFDYVISYTAIDHPWFVASQKQQLYQSAAGQPRQCPTWQPSFGQGIGDRLCLWLHHARCAFPLLWQ